MRLPFLTTHDLRLVRPADLDALEALEGLQHARASDQLIVAKQLMKPLLNLNPMVDSLGVVLGRIC